MLIDGDTLYCANVGDSKAILLWDTKKKNAYQQKEMAYANPEVITLTSTHNIEDPREKLRIIRNFGEVRCPSNREYDIYGIDTNNLRIYQKGMDVPGLLVSRVIGNELIHKNGVTEKPDIQTVKLNRQTNTY